MGKSTKSKLTTGQGLPAPLCSRFWVIYTDETGESADTLGARGPFKSRKAAEDWIKKDTLELYEDSCECLRRSKWDHPLIILEEVATVRPVIQHTIKIRLQEDSENTECPASTAGSEPSKL
jgi:hypothetical protein